MKALPAALNGEAEQTTGVICIECPGVMRVKEQGGSSALEFKCRIGHTYTEREFVEGKESQVERGLMTAKLALAELHALLGDLIQSRSPESHEHFRERMIVIEQQLRELEKIIQGNEKVVFRDESHEVER